ncbi:LacI family DNA-binding transcriptional regulator [Hephaestia sp. GCM10023244]|uniref:LacI family DNA-binding transcriptional regulator n=1 Tax=unclassified Hephaestia TaxID=2631281 RepID=UPI0020776836|nr:LacI family DNA-binding transcriptional regulator [Hephaestia sp. MAHUQ-44]MCM8732162.1 LacI family DNA-binding transcriptional regulator [Hephaestia sp. MAHUQ-44]
MADVGRLAGVSIKTVSRVFNDEPHVSDSIRCRVMDAARRLDYHPNVMAQALVRRRSHLIGLVYENPSPSYVVELQRGVLDRLKDERYRLVVIPIRSVEHNASELVGMLRSAALDGVVLAPPAADHPLILDQLSRAGISCARIAPTRLFDAAPSVIIDDQVAATDIANHLLSLGHREIAIIKGDPTHPASDARMAGYTRAFAAAGVTIRPDWIEAGQFTFDSGLEAGRRLLRHAPRPTAILAQNDDMATGALMAAREFGLRVPGDVSIAGFDDSEISRIAWPPLTTVRQPVFDMAVDAADMLIAQLERRAVDGPRDHRHQLIVRASTAPPSALP